MQTFLPYVKFASSARVLDNKRLGKQRVETLQIMRALVEGVGWINHPATKMWAGHEFALLSYQVAVCNEWTSRLSAKGKPFQDTCLEKTQALFDSLPLERRMPTKPAWLGLKKFHSAHRANLLRKDAEHYGQYGWKEEPAEGYWYPTQNGY